MVRYFLAFLGILSLSLGIIGIFVPGLPTTPFLLLATSLFVRSSKRMHHFVMNNKYLGPYITQYRQNKGMTLQQKLSSIGLMWFMSIISILFLLNNPIIKVVIFGAAVTGTLVMGLIVPNAKKNHK